MKTKKIWGNLAVKDIQRTNDFYTKLGFKPNSEMNSKEMTSFSFGESNFIINFFLKDIIEKNTKTEFTNGNEIIFSLSAESKDEVEEWINIVKNTGGKISVEPYEIGEGYTFVFSDPDGHKFNVLYYWPGM
ncbi:VOC family protein [Chryseobacterium sp. MMS23-Vi53]|uniref:VOC family protein n=1 Tax=Chryseobacterium sp. MMS23-Vi53 TaxID=3386644 RepID=UPI0039EA83A8